MCVFFSSRRRQTRCALITGVQTCALPISLEPDPLLQLDVDDLGPVVARHVDLRRRRAAPGLLDHPVQHLGDARGIAHLLLVAHHLAEHRRSEEHKSELQSLMRTSYAVFCLKKTHTYNNMTHTYQTTNITHDNLR